MNDPQPQIAAAALDGPVPACVVEGQIITGANLLFPWALDMLPIGEPFDPQQILGRSLYEVWAEAIADGRLDPLEETNRDFIKAWHARALRPEYRGFAAPLRFLSVLEQFPAADRYWKQPDDAALAGAGDEPADYLLALTSRSGVRLHFVARAEPAGPDRLMTWQPQGWTATLVDAARLEIERRYGPAQYVLDLREPRLVHPLGSPTPGDSVEHDERRIQENLERTLPTAPLDEHQIAAILEGVTPAIFADERRIITRINLRMLWTLGLLRSGERFDPDTVIGRHHYSLLVQALREGRLSPEDPENEEYFLTRLNAVIGTEDEKLPECLEFMSLVFASRHGEAWWREKLAGYELPPPYGKTGDPVAVGEVMYNVVIKSPTGASLKFVSHVRRPQGRGGPRVVAWMPSDGRTASEIEYALTLITRADPTLAYVQGAPEPGMPVNQLTALAPQIRHTGGTVRSPMRETESRPRSRPQGDIPASPAYAWRVGEEFSPEPVSDVFDRQTPEALDHPRNGRGYGWNLATGPDRTTRLELYPEEQVATLRLVDNMREPQNRDYLLQALRTERSDQGSRVAIASERDRHVSLLRVYPSGELDEHLRIVPAHQEGLPAEGVVWEADSPPTGLRADDGRRPGELTAIEAAEQLGMSRSAVTRLAQLGRLRGRQVANRKWLINAEDVANYRRGKPGPQSPPSTPVPSAAGT